MVFISARNPLLFLSFAVFFFSIYQTSAQTPFKCTSNIKECKAIVDYILPNATTISAIKNLFNVEKLTDILGVNNFPLSTSASKRLKAKQTLKIPIPCICNDGTGKSNKIPVYSVVPDDGLAYIASNVFSGLVTYQEIQDANDIPDPDIIDVDQKLWIPLPCSCDEVEGERVLHYAHIATPMSTVEGIAEEFNTTKDVLLRLNGLATPPHYFKAGTVLDVPLRACTSSINHNSMDYPLLVSNGTYSLTARDCVKCKCDSANDWKLHCQPSRLTSSDRKNCPVLQCQGSEKLYIGDDLSSGCDHAMCSYTGYGDNGTILPELLKSTCPASTPLSNNVTMVKLNGWRMSFTVIAFQLMLFYSNRFL